MAIVDAFISHQVYLQQYGSYEAGLFDEYLQEIRNEIREEVLKFGDSSRTAKRLTSMLTRLDGAVGESMGDYYNAILEDMKELAAYEAEFTAGTLETNVANVSFTTPSPNQVWQAAKFNPLSLDNKPVDFAGWLEDWQETERARLIQGVKSGFVYGKPTAQIVREVIGAGGLTDVTKRNVETIVRTAVNHVSAEAKLETYKQNKKYIKGYTLVVTLDRRTSTICRAWPQGKIYRLDGESFAPQPPFHPGCRTTTAPEVDPKYDFLKTGAKRAAKGADGGQQVAADTSYYEFLKQQPAWFQNQVLGKTRGDIFRNSGLSPEEFRRATVDGFQRPLTLEGMAKADARIADFIKDRGY